MSNSPTAAATPAQLRVFLLGPLRIERAGATIRLPRRKVETLLAFLILHPEPHPRDALASRFWGDSSDDNARHSLRTALATLRQQIGDALLLADRSTVQLNPAYPLWCDLHTLLARRQPLAADDLANPEWLRATMALWSGELLAGFYEDWLTATRQHYHNQLLELFLELTQTLRARSEYGLAIAAAQKVLAFDPANEAAHQHLMFCYVASGDRVAALQQYDLCEAALEGELDVSPAPATTALYFWIKQQDGSSANAAKLTNLPIPLTSFVGRRRESAEVKQLLDPATSRTRLLTLSGAGGSGKTRLAIQVATDLIDRFVDGVWWVELAALSEAEQVARAVAKSLGVVERADEPCRQSVTNFLDDKQLLLVIDNCEHLVAAVAQLANELLSRCPRLQIVATSRESLNVAGELIWQVPTLALPDPQQVVLTDLLLQFECIRLFVERATAVQPGFQLTLANAPAVLAICAQLDGIPLAIELAAARVKVLPVEQIAERLGSALGARFDLLTQGSRTVLPRQQTLRAAIDWSYDLLDEDERQLFRTVAVFRGGFTLEALEKILDFGNGALDSSLTIDNSQLSIDNSQLTIVNSPLSMLNPLDLLTQLVDKSLVIVEPQGDQNRYRLLETLREYALERIASPLEMEQLQRRHAEYFLQLAAEIKPLLSGPQQQMWLARLDAEHPNLRAAQAFFIAVADGEQALRLAAALWYFWDQRGYISEARQWLQKSLEYQASASDETRAKALDAYGFLALRQGNLDIARTSLSEAIALFERVENEIGIAESLQSLAAVDMNQGDQPAAQRRLEESLALCRTIQHQAGIARSLLFLGALAVDRGEVVDAQQYLLESLQVHRSLDDHNNVAVVLFNLGTTENTLGNRDKARQYFDEALALARSLGYKALVGAALRGLGMLASQQADYEQARQYANEALQIASEVGNKEWIASTFAILGDVAHKLGQHQAALAYYAQNIQLLIEIDFKVQLLPALLKIAHLLCDVDQQPTLATQILGAIDQLRRATNLSVPAEQLTEQAEVAATLRQRLGEDSFIAHWQAGEHTALAEIVADVTALTVI